MLLWKDHQRAAILLALKMERVYKPRNVDKPWNGEEIDSPSEPPEGNAALPIPVRPKPDFSPIEILGGKICFP